MEKQDTTPLLLLACMLNNFQTGIYSAMKHFQRWFYVVAELEIYAGRKKSSRGRPPRILDAEEIFLQNAVH